MQHPGAARLEHQRLTPVQLQIQLATQLLMLAAPEVHEIHHGVVAELHVGGGEDHLQCRGAAIEYRHGLVAIAQGLNQHLHVVAVVGDDGLVSGRVWIDGYQLLI